MGRSGAFAGIGYGLVYLTLSAPWMAGLALLGAVAFGPVGAVMGALPVVLAIAYSALFSEAILRRCFKAEAEGRPNGLSWTVTRIAEGHAAAVRPDLVAVSADDAPLAVAGRSWGGSGIVILSRGLIETLTETELRAVLDRGFRLLDDPALRLGTVAALLGSLPFVGRLRKATRVLVGQEGGIGSAPLRFWAVLVLLLVAPWCRYWNLVALRFTASFQQSWADEGASDAARKAETGLTNWDPLGRPEWAALAILGRFHVHPLEGLLGRGYS